ncbi:TRAP transporter large permease subunit [Lysobacter capsici]|uniref:TRAP transporter large permease subunit n=1 Tax=Lysobacter capsici TaxID=435897 RepID=UPI003D2F68D2
MEVAILFGVFAALLIIGVPVAYSLSASALATLIYIGLPPIVVVQQTAAGAGSASLIAIPLFIFAGEIMLRGGISERLIGLASAVGSARGLGQVRVVAVRVCCSPRGLSAAR